MKRRRERKSPKIEKSPKMINKFSQQQPPHQQQPQHPSPQQQQQRESKTFVDDDFLLGENIFGDSETTQSGKSKPLPSFQK